jgi:hypothetical protein
VPITRRDGSTPGIYGDAVKGWRRSPVVAAASIAVFLAVQLAIPISRIGDDARRFGWQMFSTAQFAPEFVVVTATEEIEIDHRDYVAMPRADVDFETLLPPHLCVVVPAAVSVRWEGGEHQC